ncbi:hypothetical protein BJ508DRAFT_307539 [Ascobolus immersus RN42]|uniref:F-box domain-containing protein n=1 Tax=Ascobolus immersus RN42 TaxID=1160509 RepID=A0A3N4I4L6_ASCIM|nr:hypothetical protein BJ508DRAFT_307539 [Ascobolus immersus RN42]
MTNFNSLPCELLMEIFLCISDNQDAINFCNTTPATRTICTTKRFMRHQLSASELSLFNSLLPHWTGHDASGAGALLTHFRRFGDIPTSILFEKAAQETASVAQRRRLLDAYKGLCQKTVYGQLESHSQLIQNLRAMQHALATMEFFGDGYNSENDSFTEVTMGNNSAIHHEECRADVLRVLNDFQQIIEQLQCQRYAGSGLIGCGILYATKVVNNDLRYWCFKRIEAGTGEHFDVGKWYNVHIRTSFVRTTQLLHLCKRINDHWPSPWAEPSLKEDLMATEVFPVFDTEGPSLDEVSAEKLAIYISDSA